MKENHRIRNFAFPFGKFIKTSRATSNPLLPERKTSGIKRHWMKLEAKKQAQGPEEATLRSIKTSHDAIKEKAWVEQDKRA